MVESVAITYFTPLYDFVKQGVKFNVFKLVDLEVTPSSIFLIAFDSEWQDFPTEEGQTRRHLISYQFVMNYHEIALGVLVELNGNRLKAFDVFKTLVEIMQTAGAKFEGKVSTELIAHFNIADLSAFEDFRKFLKSRKSNIALRGSIINTRPLSYKDDKWEDHPEGEVKLKGRTFKLFLRDTTKLAPAQMGSLKALGDLIGIPKLELPPGYTKDEMLRLYEERYEDFVNYAMRDALITLLYRQKRYSVEEVAPMSNAQEAAKEFKETVMMLKKLRDSDEFDKHFRFLKVIKQKITVEPNKIKTIKVLSYRHAVVHVFSGLENAYAGGRNEAFWFGPYLGDVWDFDLASCYPTCMGFVKDIKEPVRSYYKTHLEDIEFDEIGYAVVNFEFPPDVPFPNIPVRDEKGRGLLFPRKGENVFATAPELWLARKLGAKIEFVTPFMGLKTENFSTTKEAMSILIKRREELKKTYGKKSLPELLQKEKNNSVYGKTAQGLSARKTLNVYELETEKLPPSSITSPFIACMTTAFARTFISACINEVAMNGYKVFSVTTDGFNTNCPPEVMDQLKFFGLRKLYEKMREEMLGKHENMLEVKGHVKGLICVRTRFQMSLEPIEGEALILARGGYSFKAYDVPLSDLEQNNILVRLFLAREGAVYNKTKHFIPLKTLLENEDLDFQEVEVERSLGFEFDWKREPLNIFDCEFEWQVQKWRHVCFDTKPLESVDDFDCMREHLEHLRHKKKQFPILKTKTDVENLVDYLKIKRFSTTAVEDIKRTRAFHLLRAVMRDLVRNGQPKEELISKIEERFGIKFTKDDRYNAKRKNRNSKIVLFKYDLKALNLEVVDPQNVAIV